MFAFVLDALALVGFGRIEAADARRRLAHLVLVDARDRDEEAVVLDGDLDPGGDRVDLGGGKAEREGERGALERGLEFSNSMLKIDSSSIFLI